MSNEITKTDSARYLAAIETQWESEFNNEIQMTKEKQTLAQHLFIHISNSFAAFNSIWAKKNDKKNINWSNINIQKLYKDSVHIVNLGLDGLLRNHISVMPYWNKSIGGFDVDLYISYMGKDLIARKLAIKPIKDIRYELVYSTDEFIPHKKSKDNEFETYEFNIKQPFQRGEIIGGFGYIEYLDRNENKLVLITPAHFNKAKNASKGAFWNHSKEEMHYKTVVHRTVDKLLLDPQKINTSYMKVYENESEQIEEQKQELIEFDALEVDESKESESSEPGF